MTDPHELESQWYEALKAHRPDLSEEQIRVEAMKWAAAGVHVVSGADAREAAEKAFQLSYLDEGKLLLAARVIQKKGLPQMKTWIAQFWNDPAYFTGAVRAGIVTLCNLIVSGMIVIPGVPKGAWIASVVLSGLAVGIPAGRTNPTPEQIKAIAVDPTIAPVPKP